MSHINTSQFKVSLSIQQFTAVLFVTESVYRDQMPNHQRYYEGILELGEETGLNDLNRSS